MLILDLNEIKLRILYKDPYVNLPEIGRTQKRAVPKIQREIEWFGETPGLQLTIKEPPYI